MSGKYKVFFFIDSLMIGGMHRQILYLVRHMNRDLYEPIVCTHNTPEGGLREEFIKTGCKLYDLNRRRKVDFGIILRLINILNQEKVNIIFIAEAQNLFYYRIAKPFIRNPIVQVGSFRMLGFWLGHRNKIFKLVDNYFSKWLMYTSDTITANSRAVKEHFKDISSRSHQIKVIHNGFDFEYKIDKNPDKIRKELKLNEDHIMILMIARLDAWKDFDTLFNAVKNIQSKSSRYKFFVAGDGELMQSLKLKVQEMEIGESIWLLGEIKNIHSYINACDISVLSTKGEGFSNSVLESMAMGKPVIATRVGGNIEMIGEDKQCGYLFDKGDYLELSDHILHLGENMYCRCEIGKCAQEKVYEMYNLNKYISNYETLFKTLIRNNNQNENWN